MDLVGIILQCRQAVPQVLDSPFKEEDVRVFLEVLFLSLILKDTQHLTKRIGIILQLRLVIAPVDFLKRRPDLSERHHLLSFLLATFIHETATVAAAEGTACNVMQQPFLVIVVHVARLVARHPELEVDAQCRPLETTCPHVGKPIPAERQGAQEHPAVAQDAFAVSQQHKGIVQKQSQQFLLLLIISGNYPLGIHRTLQRITIQHSSIQQLNLSIWMPKLFLFSCSHIIHQS